MNSRSSTSYSTSHKLHPLSLLAQLISRQVSGCLKLTAQASEWRLLFNRGQLSFATNLADAFDRLDRQLEAIAPPVSNALREQAGQLVGAIIIEVIEPFLSIREGSYELVPAARTEGIPTFCSLDLRPIVELCQRNSKQRAAGGQITSRLSNNAATATYTLEGQVNGRFGGQSNGQYGGGNAQYGSQNGLGARSSLPTGLNQATYTVACIDDSPTVLNAIQKFLEDQSLSVVAINDPVKALMQIVRSKPDLILLDITMPNLDGYELCALLRRHPRYKRTPIVMVTGNTGLIDRARAKLVRSSGYLTKPFTQSDLLKMVFKHLPDSRR
jgi:two-component system, chemotaxis family, response regulator PixG